MAAQGRWRESVLGDSTVVVGSSATRRKQSDSHLSAGLTDVGGVFADTGSRGGGVG